MSSGHEITWNGSAAGSASFNSEAGAVGDGLGLWNFLVFANLLSEEVVDLSMAGNGRRFADRAVHIHRVTSAFTEKLDTMLFQVADQTTRFMK